MSWFALYCLSGLIFWCYMVRFVDQELRVKHLVAIVPAMLFGLPFGIFMLIAYIWSVVDNNYNRVLINWKKE